MLAVDHAGRTPWRHSRSNEFGEPRNRFGLAADTSVRFWAFDDVGGNSSSTPIPFADGRFSVSASARYEGKNADGMRNLNLTLLIESLDDKLTPRVLWRDEQVSPICGSPLLSGQCVSREHRSGVVFCLDAATDGRLLANTGQRRYCLRRRQR